MSSVVKSVGKVLGVVAKVAAPVVGFAFGGPVGAALASAATILVTGGDVKSALTSGLLSGATAGTLGALTGNMGGQGLSSIGLGGMFSDMPAGMASPLEGGAAYVGAAGDNFAMANGMASPLSGGSPYVGAAGNNYLSTSGLLSNAANIGKNLAAPTNLGNLLAAGTNAWGQYENAQAYGDAAAKQAAAQVQAAQIAADAAKFRPVGVTTNFGKSAFGYDSDGNLTSAGYVLNPQIQAQQNALMGKSDLDLLQYLGSGAATAPMGQSAQTMMQLGQGYLAQDPYEQAMIANIQQQGLLAPSRAADYSNMINRLQNQGRTGLAVGGTDTTMAANPEMAAYYNALMQQNNQIAADATKMGQQNATFGAGMVGSGGNMLGSMYKTQADAYTPYQTTLGGAAQLEGLGQGAMDIGTQIGEKSSTANAQAGRLIGQGMTNAAATMFPANANSTWGNLLTGGSNQIGNMAANSLSNFWQSPTGSL